MMVDDLLIFSGSTKANIIPKGQGYSFICDASLTYGLSISENTLDANSLAAQAGHEFPFDFTPLLRVVGGPGYILWVEGVDPAVICWRTAGTGRPIGSAFECLPSCPMMAIANLAQLLSKE